MERLGEKIGEGEIFSDCLPCKGSIDKPLKQSDS